MNEAARKQTQNAAQTLAATRKALAEQPKVRVFMSEPMRVGINGYWVTVPAGEQVVPTSIAHQIAESWRLGDQLRAMKNVIRADSPVPIEVADAAFRRIQQKPHAAS